MDISKSFLKKLLTSIVFIATFGFGQTNVSGVISSNTTWTLANSPYIVTGHLIVNEGVILTIEAGVSVQFQSGKMLQVNGSVIAIGTANNMITFTSDATWTSYEKVDIKLSNIC